jgi:hypothetical protein
LIRNATLQDGRKSVDIACRDDLIVDTRSVGLGSSECRARGQRPRWWRIG